MKSWASSTSFELLRHVIYQNDPLFKPDRTVSLVFGSVGQFFGNSLRKCVVGCFFLNILIYLNISTHMGSRLVYSAPKWQVKNHKTIIKMISTNLLAIPALGEAFSVSSFWMNLILGRVAYYLQDRHVVYQMKALCMPNALVNNVWSWRLPFQHWETFSQYLLLSQPDSWKTCILLEI